MQIFPPLTWLAAYESSWLRHDAIAGVTLAAYAIPVSLAYAGLAGLPPQASTATCSAASAMRCLDRRANWRSVPPRRSR